MANTVTIQLGEFLFEFSSYVRWVGKARGWYENAGVTSRDTIAIDAKGRICTSGSEFMRADREDAFPVKVYMAVTESEAASDRR